MSKNMESASSQAGTPDAIRPTIATGEVNGIIESQKLEWIGEIFAVMPRLQWKGIAKKGGIQGSLRLGAAG